MGEKKEFQLLVAAFGFAILTFSSASNLPTACDHNSSRISCGILGSVLCASLLATIVCLDIWRLQPADSHTLGTLFSQYIAVTKLRIMAPFARRSFYRMSKEPAVKTTTKTLLRIVRSNQDTEYGRKYRFSEINSIEDFTRLHPLTTYEHYRLMIDRILAGEQNILHPGETVYMARTAGTTGASKLFPFRRCYLEKSRYAKSMTMMNSLMPLLTMKRFFRFLLFTPINTSPGGVPFGPGSQALLRLPKHNLIPVEYLKLFKEDSSYYIIALFALAERELSHILALSPDLINSFMKFTVKNWGNICQDIERGIIGTAVDIPEEVRVALSSHLKANPERADTLRQVLRKGIVGLAKRAWPDLTFIVMSKSINIKIARKLMENHFKGIKVIGDRHIATEGLAGVNLEEKHSEEGTGEVLTLYPTLCFMEFIPLENVDEKEPKVVQLYQLQVGKCYEIVMTNENGLYRCRYGDIIKVVGHYNNIPKYKFLYRLGVRLNIVNERTPDSFLIEALWRAKKTSNIGSDITDFIMTESTVIEDITGETSKGHYVFFIEFEVKLELVSDLARKIDKCLRDSYEPYRLEKNAESIGDLEIIQVKAGVMEAVKGIMVADGVSSQFKMPRVTRKLPAIRYLMDNRIMK